MTTENPLVGTWKLVSFELRAEDGGTSHPWGQNVTGQVTYSAEGYMSGSFMTIDRPNFGSSDVMGGTAEEFAAAMKSYVGYAGSYSLKDGQVIHHASVSLFPNWTGTYIERFYAVDGNLLTLSTPPGVFGGQRVSAALVWERLPHHEVTL
jgi:hypothetical protein